MISRCAVSAILAFGVTIVSEVSLFAAEPDQLKLELAPGFSKDGIWIQRAGTIAPPEDQWIKGNTIAIPLADQSGKRPVVVRIIAYGHGCQLETLEFAPPPAGSVNSPVACRKLRTIPFRG